MASVDPTDPGGVILVPPAKSDKKKKKQISPAKSWCFTWNNYPDGWEDLLVPEFQKLQTRYGIGREICPTTGTPHLQAFVIFPKKLRPLSLGLPKQISWRVMKGTKQQNETYCGKDQQYLTNIPRPYPMPVIEPYGWQLGIVETLKTVPDKRTIHWIWSVEGSRGKSDMCRWITGQSGLCAIMGAGKAADMKHAIAREIEKHGDYPQVCIFDVPRASEAYLSYTGLEEIKNGNFYSQKYDGGQVLMPYPHVLVFANFAPDLNNKDLSVDRLKIHFVGDLTDERYYDPKDGFWEGKNWLPLAQHPLYQNTD